MPPPPILRCFTAADVQRYLRAVAGAPSASLTPSSMLSTMILPDRAIDTAGGYDLIRQGGSAERVQITEYGVTFPLWGLKVRQGQGQGAWVCPTIGAWSYNGSHAVIAVLRMDAEGVGGTFLGPLKGPNRNNPHSGDGNTYGTDRGWTWSSNGGGLYGHATYGTEGGGDQDARVFRTNVDMSIGTTSHVGRGFRIVLYGYDPNYGGAGVGAGYMWTADAAQRPVEYFDPGMGVGSVGDCSSPDGRMAFGAVMYGSNATATTPWVTYFEGVLAHLSWYTGAAADAIHLYRTAIAEGVQATL